ncbi:hypothetical protein NESM_000282200 [Novymonas esmeraldas]|uniref:Uncharacterized protein n=1 Tax=Novymonas esmeraldas TaxID=1808958 RepID=A0AAW0FCF8_9TRYP
MSTVVPPPPSGSILQKQSSFSRPKTGNGAAAAPTAPAVATPAAAGPKPPANTGAPPANVPVATPISMQKPAPTPQRPNPAAAAPPAVSPARQPGAAPVKQPPSAPGAPPAGRGDKPAPPPGMWGPNGQIAPAVPAMTPSSAAQRPAPGPGGAPAMSPASGVRRTAPGPAAAPAALPAASPATQSKRPAPGPVGAPPAASPASAAKPQSQPQPQPGGMVRQNSMNGNPYGSVGGGGFGSMGGGQMPSGTNAMGGFGSMGAGQMGGGYGSMGGGQMPSGTNAMGGFGSMGAGQMGGGYGSMGGGNANGGMGSMMGGPMGGSAYGTMGANQYGSMAGGQDGLGAGYGSMAGGAGGGSAYGSMGGGPGANPYGSMAGGQDGMGSMMGGGQMGSMYGGGMGGPSSMMGSMMMPMGSMYGGMGGPMGSMYGMGGMSTMGIAAQWGSLANMSMGGRGQPNRSGISSGYGGFASEAKGIDIEDLCPNIGTFEGATDLPRSGKRGGNHLYSRGKHEKPVATGNSNATTMMIRRKSDIKTGSGATAAAAASNGSGARPADTTSRSPARASPSTTATASGKARAKVPSNYNVHSLILVDAATGAEVTSVKDPSTVVYEKGGKKETFEADEAIARASAKDDVDSVLLSELRGNWFNGHNSAFMLCAGKGKVEAAQDVARQFVRKCLERLEKNEKDTAVKFDVTMTMVSLRGADQCCDLLKPGASYEKVIMGSSPVYGPCLLELDTKVSKTATDCVASFDAGLKNATEAKEIVAAFLILKTIKKTGAEEEVHLSSLCIALCGETVSHMTDIRDKASSAPHRLFRYAIEGACVTVSGICIAADDEDAREGLEVERKMREIKNQPPRSGNVKRFVDYTYKEITRQKEKLASASGSEKKTREAQIERMEEMVKDAKELLSTPETTQPKGYSMGR